MAELESLIQRSRAGDLDAFGDVVRRFQDMAFGYGYAILGDFHEAEDASQEAFIEAYRCLDALRTPAAFPGWFRRIVFKHCDRIMRRKKALAASLEAADSVADHMAGPAETVARRELRETVIDAVRALPDHQRMVTTLFYVNGYSQNEIADFLEVPVTTVKKRLHDSRKRLKEHVIEMVGDTLKHNAPDDRFSRKVIAELLGRPHLLEMLDHPVRKMLEAVKAALPEYEEVEGDEIVDQAAVVFPAELPGNAYFPAEGKVLRTETTITILAAMAGRMPPVRLLTAGRVFRPEPEEDALRQRVFHQIDVLCIETGCSVNAMKATISLAITAVLGPVDLQWQEVQFPRFEHGLEASVEKDGQWIEIVGCGMLAPETLRRGGYAPESVKGFAFGMSLERLAMLKFNIGDIRALWQPPYVR